MRFAYHLVLLFGLTACGGQGTTGGPTARGAMGSTGRPAAPAFRNEALLQSSSGTAELSWKGAPADLRFELQQATDRAFRTARTRYRGPDRASFISGLDNGTYYYRVRSLGAGGQRSPWSAATRLEVTHHPMALALLLFALGALVFLLTVALVVHGAATSRIPSPAEDTGAEPRA